MKQWIYTTIIHPNRISMGLTVNEFAFLDLIYQIQTHPSLTSDGWAELSYETMQSIFGLSKGGLVALGNRMIEKGFLETGKSARKKTTPAWYEYAYLDVKSGTHQNGRKVTENGRKVTEKRSKSDRKNGRKVTAHYIIDKYLIENNRNNPLTPNGGNSCGDFLNQNENACTSPHDMDTIPQVTQKLLHQAEAEKTLGPVKWPLLTDWLEWLSRKNKTLDTPEEIEAIIDDFTDHMAEEIVTAKTKAKRRGWKTLIWENKTAHAAGFPNDWSPELESKIATTELPAYWRHLRQAGWKTRQHQGRTVWTKPQNA